MKETTWLRDFIYELWARQGLLEIPDGDRSLLLQAPWGDELQVKRNGESNTVDISYYLAEGRSPRRRQLVKELEVVLLVMAQAKWAPIEFFRAKTGKHIYVQVDRETRPGGSRLTLLDAANQEACAAYCDGWAFFLREQGWLEKGVVV